MANYVPFHIHSMLSNGVTNIDSITDFHDYVDTAKSYGMKAFGFTEHGSLFAWLKKKEYIESSGMKYIHAVEAYLTEDEADKPPLLSALPLYSEKRITFYHTFKDSAGTVYADCLEENKPVKIDTNSIKDEGYKKERDNYHVVLIAKNYDGVKELNKLVSASFNRNDHHYYYMPRITFKELFATSQNILITTACLGGVLNAGTPAAKEKFLCFLEQNKERCYLEIQHHNCPEQIEYNQILYRLHKNTGIPLIVGTDTHALNDEHMEGRAMLQKAKNVRFENEDDWDLTFKSYEQLVAAYQKQNVLPNEIVLEAIENTNKMADRVEQFTVDYSAKYPKLYENSEEVFKRKINEGYISRGIYKYPNRKEYLDRIHYEYGVYEHNGAIDFMLLEENYKSEMRKRGIKYGYSRGSVSGSIIAYLLYITEIDSIKYNLNYERFMNIERISLADVDTDWLSEDREVVKEYLYNKQGLYCCDIVTFNTIALKGAIRDIGRALEIPLNEVNTICDRVDDHEEELRKKYKELFRYVDMVNGVVVSVGNHPAGCVVSPVPVDEWFGTFTTSSDIYPISMLNMKEIDSLNFVKLDILGLDNIGLIYKTCELANIPFATPDNIPPDDMNVWNSIRDDTTMIFQWESQSATQYLRKLFSDETIARIRAGNPNLSYMDLFSIGNGAIRPAGESYRDKLAQGIYQDNGNKELNDFLAPTLGFLVFQEQVIEFLHKFCGYSMGQADIVRRGFAKKTGTEKFIPDIKAGFIKTMRERYGVEEEESEKLIVNFIKVIEDASSYLFSNNHALPYSWIGYICGYLRYYYPLEFITTALNIFEDKEDKTLAIINYAKKMGIKISPIKFRHSTAKYNLDKESKQIFKGISSIKFMNEMVANELYELRENQYNTFMDLLYDIHNKTTVNSRQLTILIELDFFDEFGDANRLLKLSALYDEFASKRQIKKEKLDKLKIDYEIARACSDKESDKIFSGLRAREFLRELEGTVHAKRRTLREKISAQIEHLGYIDVADKRYSRMLAVMDVDTKYAPRIKAYSLKNGTILECKIDRRTYYCNKLAKSDIIRVLSQVKKPKLKRFDDGNFEAVPDVQEIWLTDYEKIEEI